MCQVQEMLNDAADKRLVKAIDNIFSLGEFESQLEIVLSPSIYESVRFLKKDIFNDLRDGNREKFTKKYVENIMLKESF